MGRLTPFKKIPPVLQICIWGKRGKTPTPQHYQARLAKINIDGGLIPHILKVANPQMCWGWTTAHELGINKLMLVNAAHKMGLKKIAMVQGAGEPKLHGPKGPNEKFERMQVAQVLRALGFMLMERI